MVKYKDNSPFPDAAKSRTACLLCDSAMRLTIVNSFFKDAKYKTLQEIIEEHQRWKEQ